MQRKAAAFSISRLLADADSNNGQSTKDIHSTTTTVVNSSANPLSNLNQETTLNQDRGDTHDKSKTPTMESFAVLAPDGKQQQASTTALPSDALPFWLTCAAASFPFEQSFLMAQRSGKLYLFISPTYFLPTASENLVSSKLMIADDTTFPCL